MLCKRKWRISIMLLLLNRLKSAISNMERKEEAKAKHEENIQEDPQKKDARRVVYPGDEVTDEV